MTTMLERLCRAVYRKRLGFLGDPKEEAWRMYEGEVREIVAAMRTPTDAMKEAYGEAVYYTTDTRLLPENIFGAMIDAILAEKP